MKKIVVLILLVPALGFIFPSCYYDKEETLYPFVKCDTTNVTYSQTLVPIMNANCDVCHVTGNNVNAPILNSWAALKVFALNGKLMAALNHTGPKPMPSGGSMLDNCSIRKFQKWVSQGAPDN